MEDSYFFTVVEITTVKGLFQPLVIALAIQMPYCRSNKA
jgi:hypothetical protein